MRIIRWVGHPSPLYDHNIMGRISKGHLDPALVLAFEQFEHNRKISVRRGASIFRIGPEQGYRRPYQWGPQYFDVEMDDRDWARLARNPLDRYMMLDVTDGVPPFRPLLSAGQWRELVQAAKAMPAPQTFIPPGRW